MGKTYFKKFKWIKKAKNAKSLSFYSEDANCSFSKDLYKEFFKILKKEEDRFRISLHTNSEADLHNMVIAMKKNNYVYPHKHKKSESYQIIKGSLLLIYFSENAEIKKTILLNKKNHLIARVEKNTYHAAISLKDTVYHETRIGPFEPNFDSIIPNWCNEKKEEFMIKLRKNLKKDLLCM